jgi:hypothetical protein
MIKTIGEIEVGDRISFLDWSCVSNMFKVKNDIHTVKKMIFKSTGDNQWRFPMLKSTTLNETHDLFYNIELATDGYLGSWIHGFTEDYKIYKHTFS